MHEPKYRRGSKRPGRRQIRIVERVCQDHSRITTEIRLRGERAGHPQFRSDEGLGRVLGDLAESGYDAEWDCIPAATVGAPHIRDRLFLLAWHRDTAQPLADSNNSGRQERRRPSAVSEELQASQRHGRRIPGGFPPPPGDPAWEPWLAEHPTAQPGIRRDLDGVSKSVDEYRRHRLKALGNAVVPQASARAWDLLIDRAGVVL